MLLGQGLFILLSIARYLVAGHSFSNGGEKKPVVRLSLAWHHEMRIAFANDEMLIARDTVHRMGNAKQALISDTSLYILDL